MADDKASQKTGSQDDASPVSDDDDDGERSNKAAVEERLGVTQKPERSEPFAVKESGRRPKAPKNNDDGYRALSKSNDDYRALSRLSESDVRPRTPAAERMETDEAASPLDFSVRASSQRPAPHKRDAGRRRTPNGPSRGDDGAADAPLDLSIGKRQSSAHLSKPVSTKVLRLDRTSPWNYAESPPPPLPSPTAKLSEMSSMLWNGKLKAGSGGKLSSPSPSSGARLAASGGHAGRQNPWQTQWINRSSEQTRDVFTCVWCKESFRSLAEMTDHMKRSPRCGMAGMQQAATAAPPTAAAGATLPNHGVGSTSTAAAAHPHHQSPSSSSSSSKEPISSSVLAKNNVGLPRKLVRGQDVWLGRGAEQTRQILKCESCIPSFPS